MDLESPDLCGCSPWVRLAKVQEERGLAGEWVDADHVFTFIHRGRAEFIFDGLRLHAGEGTALVMPPGVRHVLHSPPGVAFVQHIVHFDLVFDPARAGRRGIGPGSGLAPEASPFAGNLPWAELPPAAAEECRARFAELRAVPAGAAAALRRQACLLQLVALVLEHQGGDGRRPAPSQRISRAWHALDRAVQHIHARLDDPGLDIAAIARATRLSPAYLPELFRTQLGVPVRRYLLHLRVRRARDLLAGGASVTAAAEATGFRGIHAFSRAFRRVTGMPPSAVEAAADPRPG